MNVTVISQLYLPPTTNNRSYSAAPAAPSPAPVRKHISCNSAGLPCCSLYTLINETYHLPAFKMALSDNEVRHLSPSSPWYTPRKWARGNLRILYCSRMELRLTHPTYPGVTSFLLTKPVMELTSDLQSRSPRSSRKWSLSSSRKPLKNPVRST